MPKTMFVNPFFFFYTCPNREHLPLIMAFPHPTDVNRAKVNRGGVQWRETCLGVPESVFLQLQLDHFQTLLRRVLVILDLLHLFRCQNGVALRAQAMVGSNEVKGRCI